MGCCWSAAASIAPRTRPSGARRRAALVRVRLGTSTGRSARPAEAVSWLRDNIEISHIVAREVSRGSRGGRPEPTLQFLISPERELEHPIGAGGLEQGLLERPGWSRAAGQARPASNPSRRGKGKSKQLSFFFKCRLIFGLPGKGRPAKRCAWTSRYNSLAVTATFMISRLEGSGRQPSQAQLVGQHQRPVCFVRVVCGTVPRRGRGFQGFVGLEQSTGQSSLKICRFEESTDGGSRTPLKPAEFSKTPTAPRRRGRAFRALASYSSSIVRPQARRARRASPPPGSCIAL